MESIDEIEKVAGALRLQALFRGIRSRDVHVKRKKQGSAVVCPFVCSTDRIAVEVCKLSNMTERDTMIDLGCGDGSVLIKVASETNAQCIGYEIDPILCATANRKIAEANLLNVTVVEGDMCSADFFLATVIYLFLVPSAIRALSPILLAKARPGVRIVSYHFELPVEDGWLCTYSIDTDDVINHLKAGSKKKIFLYVVPP